MEKRRSKYHQVLVSIKEMTIMHGLREVSISFLLNIENFKQYYLSLKHKK